MSDEWKADLVGELIACGLASTFFGSAFYCSGIAVPVMLSHHNSNRHKLECWNNSFDLAKISQSLLATLGGVAGVCLYQFKGAPKEFAYGGGCLLAMIPFTAVVILPRIRHNKDLLKKVQEESRLDSNEDFKKSAVDGIKAWANAHHVRTVFGGIGMGLMLRGLAKYGH